MKLAPTALALIAAKSVSAVVYFDPSAPVFSCHNPDGTTLEPAVPTLLEGVDTTYDEFTLLLRPLRPSVHGDPTWNVSDAGEGQTVDGWGNIWGGANETASNLTEAERYLQVVNGTNETTGSLSPTGSPTSNSTTVYEQPVDYYDRSTEMCVLHKWTTAVEEKTNNGTGYYFPLGRSVPTVPAEVYGTLHFFLIFPRKVFYFGARDGIDRKGWIRGEREKRAHEGECELWPSVRCQGRYSSSLRTTKPTHHLSRVYQAPMDNPGASVPGSRLRHRGRRDDEQLEGISYWSSLI